MIFVKKYIMFNPLILFIMNEDKIIELVTAVGSKLEDALKDGRVSPSEAISIAVAIISLLIRVFSKQKSQ